MEKMLGGLLILIGFGSAFAYLPLQVNTALHWRGGWRVTALLPLALMIPVFIYTVYAFAQDSNLWPMVLLYATPVATVYLVILYYAHRSAKRSDGTEPL